MSRSAAVFAHRVWVRVLRGVAALALLLMPVEHHDGDSRHHLHAGFQIWSDVLGGLKSQHVGVANPVRTVERVDTVTTIVQLSEYSGMGRDYRPSATITDLLALVLPSESLDAVHTVRPWTTWVLVVDPPPRVAAALR